MCPKIRVCSEPVPGGNVFIVAALRTPSKSQTKAMIFYDEYADVPKEMIQQFVAEQQQRLMQHYQPDGGYEALNAQQAMYHGSLNMIAAMTLTIRQCNSSCRRSAMDSGL
jgi:hypothetical protein